MRLKEAIILTIVFELMFVHPNSNIKQTITFRSCNFAVPEKNKNYGSSKTSLKLSTADFCIYYF